MDHLVMEPVAGFRFQADWIGPELEPGYENCYFQAVREFWLDEVPESALLRIAADTSYVLWLNGLKVASGPVRGTAKLCYFDTLEVAPLLRPGRNVIAVLVHSPVRENFIVAPAAPRSAGNSRRGRDRPRLEAAPRARMENSGAALFAADRFHGAPRPAARVG